MIRWYILEFLSRSSIYIINIILSKGLSSWMPKHILLRMWNSDERFTYCSVQVNHLGLFNILKYLYYKQNFRRCQWEFHRFQRQVRDRLDKVGIHFRIINLPWLINCTMFVWNWTFHFFLKIKIHDMCYGKHIVTLWCQMIVALSPRKSLK